MYFKGYFAPGILAELKNIVPHDSTGRGKHKFHQRLAIDFGHPKLAEHLASVIILMRASSNWKIFYRLIQRALPKFGENIPPPFNKDEGMKIMNKIKLKNTIYGL